VGLNITGSFVFVWDGPCLPVACFDWMGDGFLPAGENAALRSERAFGGKKRKDRRV
jgi:hypothetical protein